MSRARRDGPARAASIGERYAQAEKTHAELRRSLVQRMDVVANARLFAFLGVLAGLVWQEVATPSERLAPLILTLVATATFVTLVIAHGVLRSRAARARVRERLAAEGLRRLERDWDALPAWRGPEAAPDHPYAADLDVFGRASLVRLFGPVATPAGRAALVRTLLEPAKLEVCRARRAAVIELAVEDDLRDELAARGRLAGSLRTGRVERFLDWTEGDPWLRGRPALLAGARLLTAATLALVALDAAGILPGHWWVATVAANLLLTVAFGSDLNRVRRDASPADGLAEVVSLLDAAATLRPEAPLLRTIRGRLRSVGADDPPDLIAAGGGGKPTRARDAASELRRLSRILHLADLRLSLVHLFAQLLVLWDFHAEARLEAWAERNRGRPRDWLEGLGELEALAATATLARERPDWTGPELRDGPAGLDAQGLAHPLLPRKGRVGNDVSLGPPGTALLVTGSNMAGKSTLLRAIGANAVLAGTGAPVCAGRYVATPLRPFTSMRIRDSLAEGVSLFMAEVRRLKALVDAAESGSGRVLYLLDEILQGTNAEEHGEGARWVLNRLLRTKSIGALATHDLSLATDPALAPALRSVHFREEVVPGDEEPRMDFDYALRPGPATSRNALRLMRLAGLGPPDEGADQEG